MQATRLSVRGCLAVIATAALGISGVPTREDSRPACAIQQTLRAASGPALSIISRATREAGTAQAAGRLRSLEVAAETGGALPRVASSPQPGPWEVVINSGTGLPGSHDLSRPENLRSPPPPVLQVI